MFVVTQPVKILGFPYAVGDVIPDWRAKNHIMRLYQRNGAVEERPNPPGFVSNSPMSIRVLAQPDGWEWDSDHGRWLPLSMSRLGLSIARSKAPESPQDADNRCEAVTKAGNPCKGHAVGDTGSCGNRAHKRQVAAKRLEG